MLGINCRKPQNNVLYTSKYNQSLIFRERKLDFRKTVSDDFVRKSNQLNALNITEELHFYLAISITYIPNLRVTSVRAYH